MDINKLKKYINKIKEIYKWNNKDDDVVADVKIINNKNDKSDIFEATFSFIWNIFCFYYFYYYSWPKTAITNLTSSYMFNFKFLISNSHRDMFISDAETNKWKNSHKYRLWKKSEKRNSELHCSACKKKVFESVCTPWREKKKLGWLCKIWSLEMKDRVNEKVTGLQRAKRKEDRGEREFKKRRGGKEKWKWIREREREDQCGKKEKM